MVKRFFIQAYLFYKGRRAAFNAEEFIGLQLLYPLITLIFYCLIASYSFKTTDLTSWVIGNAFLLCTNSCIFGLGNIFVGERYYGRLRSIIASPCSKFALILANGLFPALIAVISSLLGLVVGSVVFHVDFSGVNIPLTLLTIVCAMISASCFGLFLSVFGLISDSMHLVLNAVSYLLMIFTGAEFPIEQLPMAGRIISEIMPLTKAIKAMNLLFTSDQSGYLPLLLSELLTGAVYALLAWGIFDVVEKRACREGTFDLF